MSIPTLQIGSKTLSARRYAFTALVQEPQGRLQVLSACGNDVCVNPLHAKYKRPYSDAKRNWTKEWRRKYPERAALAVKSAGLKSKYGLTIADVRSMLSAQLGACAICRVDLDNSDPRRRECIDHCHNSGGVRAILCNECNSGLGRFRDRPDLLRAAADYLERHASKAAK